MSGSATRTGEVREIRSEHRTVQPFETRGKQGAGKRDTSAVPHLSFPSPTVRRFYVEKDENGVPHVTIRREGMTETKKYRLDEFNDALKKSADAANRKMKDERRELRFELREEAGIYQVTVLDTSRDENDPRRVVRRIPPEETIRFIENIREMTGLILDMEL